MASLASHHSKPCQPFLLFFSVRRANSWQALPATMASLASQRRHTSKIASLASHHSKHRQKLKERTPDFRNKCMSPYKKLFHMCFTSS
jgi:hypothetical protein